MHARLMRTTELLQKAKDLHFRASSMPVESCDKCGTRKDWLDEPELMYHNILNSQIGNWHLEVLYCVATLEMNRNHDGIAALLFSFITERMPHFVEAWNNFGISCKKQGHMAQAVHCFEQAMKHRPAEADFPNNAAACYINEGMPQEAEKWARKALELNPDHQQARWHLGLALLEQQRFSEAWDHHEARLDRSSGCGTALRNYEDQKGRMTPWWNGKSPGLVVVHGEQGLGDEIMFASCLEDAAKVPGVEIVWESSPRTGDLFARSFAHLENVKVHGTHKTDGTEWRNGRRVDFKCGVGSLPRFFRKEGVFPGTPYLVASPEKRRHWRKEIASKGRGPKIGIAWQGGALNTRVDLRSIVLDEWAPLIKGANATFFSLQYTQHAGEEVREFKTQHGIENLVHYRRAAQAKNLDELAAFIAELDLVISVCQTAIHLAGSLGVPCWCLTPAKPAWRYGITGDMPWYDSVDLIRQERSGEWGSVMAETKERLARFLEGRRAA